MIFIVSRHDDPDAVRIAAKLEARGHECICFDPRDFPDKVAISFHIGQGAARTRVRIGSRDIDFADVRVGWFRHPGRPVAPPGVTDARRRNYIEDECRFYLENLWSSLSCNWFPGPRHVMYGAEHKLRQLVLAKSLGFMIPETLATNDPESLMAFHRRQDGSIVSKLIGPSLQRHYPGLRRYTEQVSRFDLVHHRSVRLTPLLFQGNLSKHVEIRASVVGGRVFAAEIHSQATRRTQQDWRRYHHARTPLAIHPLPAAVAARCVAMVERLGLRYGAIDLILTPRGEYVFLEVNPSGQWAWIEAQTGLPIDAAICDLLGRMEDGFAAVSSERFDDEVELECAQ